MTAPPIFPALPGLGWSVHKKPTLSTRVASHTSGREVRAGLYAHALYEFELTFDGLDSSGVWTGLQAQSLQTLMGFFLTAQGQLNTFLYVDPTDNSAADETIGAGDGTTTTFTLGRSIGGLYEPISYATDISSVTINGAPATDYSFTAPNAITFSSAPLAPGQVYNLAEATGTNIHSSYVNGPSLNAGDVVVFGAYLKAEQDSQAQLLLKVGSGDYAFANFDLSAGTVHNSGNGATAASIFPCGSGWFYATVTAPTTTAMATEFEIVTLVGFTNNYAGVAGNGIEFCGANYSVNGAAAVALGPMTASSSATLTAIADSTAPAGPVVAWSGAYAFQCRFFDDQLDFENFASGLWTVKSVKFRSVR